MPASAQNKHVLCCLLQAEVSRLRAEAEAYLLHHLCHIPDPVGPAGSSFRLQAASGTQPTASPVDLLALASSPSWGPEPQLLAFNPFLSAEACAQLRQGVLVWLQLCVLEDRMECLVKLAGAGEEYTPLLIRVRACLQAFLHVLTCADTCRPCTTATSTWLAVSGHLHRHPCDWFLKILQ